MATTTRSQLAAVSLAMYLMTVAACTWHHSKVPIPGTQTGVISPDAVFVSEDDSGLAILGIFVISEPDHYAVLLERMRRRYKCARLHHVQLDFYSDFWLFVGFPIARVTAICEPEAQGASDTPGEPSPQSDPSPPASGDSMSPDFKKRD